MVVVYNFSPVGLVPVVITSGTVVVLGVVFLIIKNPSVRVLWYSDSKRVDVQTNEVLTIPVVVIRHEIDPNRSFIFGTLREAKDALKGRLYNDDSIRCALLSGGVWRHKHFSLFVKRSDICNGSVPVLIKYSKGNPYEVVVGNLTVLSSLKDFVLKTRSIPRTFRLKTNDLVEEGEET